MSSKKRRRGSKTIKKKKSGWAIAHVSDSTETSEISESSSSDSDICVSKVKGIWQFQTNDGKWVSFKKKDSSLLEKYYKKRDCFTTDKLSFNTKRDFYTFDFILMEQRNKHTGKRRSLRRLKKKRNFDKKVSKKRKVIKKKKKLRRADSPETSKIIKYPKKVSTIKKQAHYGEQSRRGIKSFSFGPTINKDKHGKYCFEKMIENEQRLCGEWAVMYHSYSVAALLYEVQAAIACVLFRFKSTFASLPRLLMSPFKKLATANDLMKKIKVCKSDHDGDYRAVAICASTSLVSTDPEATPKDIFLSGYSCTDVSFMGVLEKLLGDCHVPKSRVKSIAKKIVKLSEKYGLDVSQFGGKACASGRAGHLLQIFIKRSVIDNYAYAAKPYGIIDTKRQPISVHLAKNEIIKGQVRICCNPQIFLKASAARMFVYSADPKFHKHRELYQEKMTHLLRSILGSHKVRLSAARGIFGGKLPSWFESDDQSAEAKIENPFK